MTSVMNLINNSFSAVSSWFVSIFNSSGMTEIYISILFIYFGYKFILSPVLGKGRGSDFARSKKDDINE